MVALIQRELLVVKLKTREPIFSTSRVALFEIFIPKFSTKTEVVGGPYTLLFSHSVIDGNPFSLQELTILRSHSLITFFGVNIAIWPCKPHFKLFFLLYSFSSFNNHIIKWKIEKYIYKKIIWLCYFYLIMLLLVSNATTIIMSRTNIKIIWLIHNFNIIQIKL